MHYETLCLVRKIKYENLQIEYGRHASFGIITLSSLIETEFNICQSMT